MLPKFSKIDKIEKIDKQEEWYWDNLYQRETTDKVDRVLIGCKNKEIPTILELCRNMKGPFCILYVLLISRIGNESGRYQSPEYMTYEELELFLYEHQEFFEQDGRHHLWVVSMTSEGQFIYDKHNFIFAYGAVSEYIEKLEELGFQEGEISTPVPHAHYYHYQFDDEEEAVMKKWNWIHSPLQDEDDL